MKFRIQSRDGRHVAWEQFGPLVVRERDARKDDVAVMDSVLWFSEDEAQEFCLELAYQIMRLRHPGLPE